MRHLKTISLLLISVLFITSCSRSGDKFEGEWTPVEDTFGGNKIIQRGSIVIKAEDGAYAFYTKDEDGGKNKMGVFLYNNEKDILSLSDRGENIDIEYHKNSKHLIVNNHKNGESLELKRKK